MQVERVDVVTFERGAHIAVEAARLHGSRLAVLKQHSPSCGTRTTGTAQGRAPGRGRAAQALLDAGLEIRGEDELG